MSTDNERNVVSSWPVITRQQVITALTISEDCTRAFLGIEQGLLEEYEVLHSSDGTVKASLTARKPVAPGHPIVQILPAISATCLVVLSGDGALRAVHSDTLEARVLHKGPILAAAVAHDVGQFPRLAIAHRVGITRAVRISVYDIFPAGGHVPSWRPLWSVDLVPTQGPVCLAWAGESIVCGLGHKYLLVWARQAADTGRAGNFRELLRVEDDAVQSATTVVSRKCALLLVNDVGLVVNAFGEPVGNPLPLESLPPVLACAEVGGYIAMVCRDGMHIFDPGIAQRVQTVAYGHGLSPAPGQPLRAAGGCVPGSKPIALVAGRHRVWALAPLAPAEQARQLLVAGRIEEALELAAAGETQGASWAEEAHAQAALLLLHDSCFRRAADALDHCSPAIFQPAELFPLFPSFTSSWQPFAAPLHWGLHPGSLPPLEALVAAGLQGDVGNDQAEADALQDAQQAIVGYLFRARELPGVIHLDGVDTLLMHLLIDLDAASETEAFAAIPNAVVLHQVAPRLETKGWMHSLATLQAAHASAEPALRIWRDMIAALSSSTNTNAAVGTQRKEVLSGAINLLRNSSACPAALVLQHVSWLLDECPEHVIDVLASREDVSPMDVLPSLQPGSDARWQYMHRIIVDGTAMEDSKLHTELALALIAAIFQRDPELQRSDSVDCVTCLDDHHSSIVHQEASGRARTHLAALSGATANGHDMADAPVNVTTLVSGVDYSPGGRFGAAGDAGGLRLLLRAHLEQSEHWSPSIVLPLLVDSKLHQECVVAYWRCGEHTRALRLLVLVLHDVSAAITYAEAFLPPKDHALLLSLVLNSGTTKDDSRWTDAALVVSALGATLNPVEVLAAVPDNMPLEAAVAFMTPLLRERIARSRSVRMKAALHRTLAMRGALRRASGEAGRVIVDEGKACLDCQLRIGSKVFVAMPLQSAVAESGAEQHLDVLCLNCWNKRRSAQESPIAL